MILERFAYTPLGTFGNAFDGPFKCATMEEVWAKNASNISCIPEGIYLCRRGKFPKWGETFEVTGVQGRNAILFHPGNTIADVEGCICPGEKFGVVNSLWAVVSSGDAYKRLMAHFAGVDQFQLEIRFNPGYP